ncbi:MAG: TIGR01777 family oxidoreductase [Vampirovibrionales bacterium]|nr:TIGR01777 family oxidoreductase [Vampirovibrionales bacterium]
MAVVAVTGAKGLVGTALRKQLEQSGHKVIRITRSTRLPEDPALIAWNVQTGELQGKALQDVEAIIHLAGENIAAGRWNDELMAKIRDSRVPATQKLAEFVAENAPNVKTFLCASAIGYYGDREDELLTEASAPGLTSSPGFDKGFMSAVCQAWEAALTPLSEKNVRVAKMRFGIVLSKRGGALAKMLPPFLLGMGGPLASGKQYMSWIGLEDLARAIVHVLHTDSLHGQINMVSPNPVRNSEFTKALGKALFRPTFAPVPAMGMRILFGKMADEVLMASARVLPLRLQETGFEFTTPQIGPALKQALK